jgi:hypothetical protein
MENEFVPYEIALALKELGFDEPCFGWFTDTHLRIGFVESKHVQGENEILAPLYQQAFRWFREVHGLEIILRPDQFNDESKKLREYVIISYNKSWKLEEILEPNHWVRKGCFKTPEEAEFECLKKLIEIVKSKK